MKYFKAYHKSFYISRCYLLGDQDLIKNNHNSFLQQQFLNNISYLGHNSKFYDYLGKKRHSTDSLFESGLLQGPHIVLSLLTSTILHWRSCRLSYILYLANCLLLYCVLIFLPSVFPTKQLDQEV